MHALVKGDQIFSQVMQAITDLLGDDPAKAADVRAGAQQIIGSPDYGDYLNLAGLFKSCLDRPAKTTLVCCREHTPVTMALFLNLGTTAGLLERVLAGNIDQADFSQISSAAAKCSAAKVSLGEARSLPEFTDLLLAAREDIEMVLCDWRPSDDEIASVATLVAEHGISFTGPLSQWKADAILSAPPTPALEAARARRRCRHHEHAMNSLERFQQVSDLRINDGYLGVFDASLVAEADIWALGSEPDCVDVLPAPFAGWRYSWGPAYGGIRFSIFAAKRQVLTCAIASAPDAGEKVWVRLRKKCATFQNGLPPDELLRGCEGVDYEDVTSQTHALKYGCNDLIAPDVKLECPPVPFLATLISPPGHRDPESDELKMALRLRDAVAAIIFVSDWMRHRPAE